MSLAEIIRQYFQLGTLFSETIAFVIILSIALIVAWIGHALFRRYFLRWAAKTNSTLDDAILRNIRAPIFLLAILFGIYFVTTESYNSVATLDEAKNIIAERKKNRDREVIKAYYKGKIVDLKFLKKASN